MIVSMPARRFLKSFGCTKTDVVEGTQTLLGLTATSPIRDMPRAFNGPHQVFSAGLVKNRTFDQWLLSIDGLRYSYKEKYIGMATIWLYNQSLPETIITALNGKARIPLNLVVENLPGKKDFFIRNDIYITNTENSLYNHAQFDWTPTVILTVMY